MAFDGSDTLFVSAGESIRKITPDRKKSTFVSGLGNPIDLAFDNAGNLFVTEMAVADARAGRPILRFSADGTKRTFASGLSDPAQLATDRAGNVYVTEVTAADSSSHAVLKFDPDGKQTTLTSAVGSARPRGLICDGAGNVFAANDHAVLKFDPAGTRSTFASDRISPDQQWEFLCSDDGAYGGIGKADTTEILLDLSADVPRANTAEVFWAPDSKRFAFTYSPPHAPHTSYETTTLYQLRGDEFVALPPLVDDSSHQGQLPQLAKDHRPKDAAKRRVWASSPTRDILRLRQWTDANTAVLYARAAWPERNVSVSYLFTVKFDAQGNWRISDAHEMSAKEIAADEE